MRISFLGTGTSHGVPVIGCSCKVCKSKNPKNKRNRTSIHIKTKNTNLLIDTPPEMRLELIMNNIQHVDAVLITHAHADHIMGFDDIRALNWQLGHEMPVYSDKKTLESLKRIFPYIFSKENHGGGIPQVELIEIKKELKIYGENIIPLPIYHGKNLILGYRIKKFAYITDCSSIPDQTKKLLTGVDYIAVDSLRYSKHPTHFSVDEAVDLINELNIKKGYLTHISHQLDHEKLNDYLPDYIEPAYDGMVIEV
ncbi:phosphoribosyl 1,2-cyclic phosphate phosphodiesterase [Halanaerobium sp. DL-01]|uniref:MBL fold metallo-hydrolase n=2 Tax=unclassified Halanaerobium TaxID=2641197 RepID=UPI000DF1EE98|nr:MBL fold metallo-hydrolase [Halanaerobium sp. DL-01]RCW89266.1 phosphoribosyl 1,2-cyclic phosphate phosphodiesterase [Halanaerobium sp. DL-01]